MDIPVVVHRNGGSVYGVTVPDIPGCHSHGDTIDEAMHNVKKAICSHMEILLESGKDVNITCSKLEALAANPDYADGVFALVDINLSKLDSKPERINISIPRFVLKKIDAYAEKRHETRSGLLSRAAMSLIAEEA